MALFQYFCISASILSTILNISKCPTMTRCQQLEYSKAMSELQESTKKKTLNPISRSRQFSPFFFQTTDRGKYGIQNNDCEPPHDKTNKMASAHSKDSDQPGHPPSLIRVFAVRMKKAWVLSYPLSAQRILIRLGRCPG